MRRAGAAILAPALSGRSQFEKETVFSTSSKLPFSFTTALDQIEEEILLLAAEVSHGKKEVGILKSEQDTIVEVANSQTADIERYLQKEILILKDVISKQHTR